MSSAKSSQRSHHGDKLAACAERDEWKARAERAEGLLREFADEENWQDCLWCAGSGVDRQDHKHQMRCGVCQGRLKTFYDDAADEKSGGILGRARAALSQENEGG